MDHVTVTYTLEKDVCHCCQQPLPKPEESAIGEFTFHKATAMEYAPWEDIVEIEAEFEQIVEEFVYETIQFYGVSQDDKLVVGESELLKVKQFLLNNIES